MKSVIELFKSYVTFFLSGVCLLFSLSGCSDDDEDLPPAPVSYTTLIYMMADNSMDSEVEYTISQLKAGAKHSAGSAVVYVDRMDEAPRLFKITQTGEEVALKNYEEESSATVETLVQVIEDTKEQVPSEKFGLILWSHAMGWLPWHYSINTRCSTYQNERNFPHTRYIGVDSHLGSHGNSTVTMTIDKLADALPDHIAEYIWFDACLMGSVEVLYELRNKCNYIVASPAEVLAEANYDASGISYSKVLPYLFGGKEELAQACQTYFNHYNGMKQEILRTATITLIDATELDGLYDVVHDMLGGHLTEIGNMDVNDLQAYHTDNVPQVFFDLADVLNHFKGTNNDATLENQMKRTVLYKATTDQIINKLTINKDKFSGLSVYVPLAKWNTNPEYEYYFSSMDWSNVYSR